ncbi:CAAX amino protease [Sorangium cellulosum]|uniref:CAAX amino protease n=1 Tax=Sorangium cellulosum TaxID=56 RepID=A0A2L0F7F9_SORCE|nr:CPBP family intramembrane glutamic endopeptidase [Sorangium cellulosum]AUX47447.1 CAAX amino protease [Sorangium cellulosum]
MIYVGGPVLLTFGFRPPPVLAAVWLGLALSLVLLLRDPGFERGALIRAAPPRELAWVLARFAAAAAASTIAGALIAPDRLFGFVRERPGLWALVMIGYPLFSVVPQGLLYRALLFHRYAALFPAPPALVGGLLFGFGHIAFRNWVAVALTTVGGVLFSRTYLRTRSLPLSCLEHALYGCFVFSIGLGEFLYSGALR